MKTRSNNRKRRIKRAAPPAPLVSVFRSGNFEKMETRTTKSRCIAVRISPLRRRKAGVALRIEATPRLIDADPSISAQPTPARPRIASPIQDPVQSLRGNFRIVIEDVGDG